jgi:hypothetical protein
MNKSTWTGTVFVMVGALFAYKSTDYNLGNLALIGPGFFPLAVSISLIAVGVSIILRELYGNFK